MPGEAGKHSAKHFLVQQWMRDGEYERRGDVPAIQGAEAKKLVVLQLWILRIRGFGVCHMTVLPLCSHFRRTLRARRSRGNRPEGVTRNEAVAACQISLELI